MKMNKEQMELLGSLHASVRFRSSPPSFVWNPTTKALEQTSAGYCECVVIDNPTGEEYLWERGADEREAFAKAFAKVPTAPKPLTETQKATAALVKSETDKALESANAKIAELEAKLRAATEPPFEGGVPTVAKATPKAK